jgi:hypothetical protein
MLRNQEVATLLENLAELQEAKNESLFRIGAAGWSAVMS